MQTRQNAFANNGTIHIPGWPPDPTYPDESMAGRGHREGEQEPPVEAPLPSSRNANVCPVSEYTNGRYTLHFTQLNILYPQLSPTELRIAALIRGGNASGQIAKIIGITDETIENYRVGIRRKLRLLPDQKLSHYLGNLEHASAMASLR